MLGIGLGLNRLSARLPKITVPSSQGGPFIAGFWDDSSIWDDTTTWTD